MGSSKQVVRRLMAIQPVALYSENDLCNGVRKPGETVVDVPKKKVYTLCLSRKTGRIGELTTRVVKPPVRGALPDRDRGIWYWVWKIDSQGRMV